VIVLGLDTATPRTAVALLRPGAPVEEAVHDPAPGERPGHVRALLPLAHAVVQRAGLRLADVERIAVGTGPGTFTGLRIGIATARALAQGTGAELVGVGTLAALAEPLAAPAEPDDALAEPVALAEPLAALAEPVAAAETVLAVLDARRGEAFVAAYARGGPDGLHELLAPRTATPDELPELAAAAGARGVMAVGDGAVRFRSALERGQATVPPDRSPVHRVSAAAVCRLGARTAQGDARDAVVPHYLRPPDAQPRRP